MSSEPLIQLAQLSTIIIGVLGIAVALRSHRRQMHAQMFIEFSARFHHALGSMPVEIWIAEETSEPMPARSAALTQSCLQCFHLIAGLYFLNKGGYVSRELWRPFQHGIRRVMQGAVLQREWFAVEPIFSHNTEFCRYMRRMIHAEAAASSRSDATRFWKVS